MPRKGQKLSPDEKAKISRLTKAAMQRPEVRQNFLNSLTPERLRKIVAFHKVDALRPERIAQSIAHLPQTMKGSKNPHWKGGKRKTLSSN